MVLEVRPLREWRGIRGLAIRELASMAQVSPDTVVRIEAGAKPHARTAVRLARALEIDPAQLARTVAEKQASPGANPEAG